ADGHGIRLLRIDLRVAADDLPERVVDVAEERIVRGRALPLRIEPLGQRRRADVARERAAEPERLDDLPVETRLVRPDAAAPGIIREARREMEIEPLRGACAGHDREQHLAEDFTDLEAEIGR